MLFNCKLRIHDCDSGRLFQPLKLFLASLRYFIASTRSSVFAFSTRSERDVSHRRAQLTIAGSLTSDGLTLEPHKDIESLFIANCELASRDVILVAKVYELRDGLVLRIDRL